MKLDRRTFLQAAIGSGCAYALGLQFFDLAGLSEAQAAELTELVRSTCSPNCTGACGFKAQVVNGRISTLIQAADYPEQSYNPRGCLRGLSMMDLIYGKDRLKYPLIRTGARGSGEFRRAGWDEALDYCAAKLTEIAEKYGPEAIATTVQVPGTGYVQKGAMVALAGLANWTMHHGYDQNGDLPMFWPMTFGVQSEELESLEWPNARTTMIFGSNVIQTRLPDAHHLIEAKRRGRVIVVDPDFCSTAAKADHWLPIKADTDAALALGMARVIIDNGRYNRAFMQDFTDFPLLVRRDTGKRLLAEETAVLAEAARQKEIPDYRRCFVVHAGGSLQLLDPEDLRPTDADLEGEFQVELIDGRRIVVETVLTALRRTLTDYDLDRVAEITGLDADQIEQVALDAAANTPLHIIYGASNYQWYNGDLKGRALSLLPVLTGSIGVSGGGISTYAGQYRIRFNLKSWWFPEGSKLNWVPYLHFLQGDGPGYPKHGIKAMVGGWGNPFDQHNMSNILKDRATSGELEFILTTDFQMSTSCVWSDVVLPAPSWYEKHDLTATILHPYLQLQQPAIKPLFESRSELWIFRELAKRLNPAFEKHFYPELDENEAAIKAIEVLLATGGRETEGITLEMLRRGPIRLNSPAPDNRQIPFYEEVQHRRPFPPRSYPAPLTATAQFLRSGRIEFYKDEDLFLSEGEQLPVHKETYLETEYKVNPDSRVSYRLRFVTKNSLYRVHSTHSNNSILLELQDNKPKVFLHEADAHERHIDNGDLVQIYNDRGQTRANAVIDPGCSRGTAIFEEGWWSRYLAEEGYNTLTCPWIKPLHEIYFVPGIWSPTTVWNECLVDVRRISA
ncbi:molybdopterin-dependent oxidoreductase [Desulfofustis glycolicus]|uniref:Respiratory nitrate reductase alpha subunit apoprotein n=1 Tax=Desulfofustis glycolicus DSM 9705 TaxID=1121409 RepID=A0A1M5TGL4_9BACT|nr:molybdopterin-dependent oxidoreductase [Desulfofustis glycolicus]MCB2216399.1 molybdopterin-dependent oxidoreductase [Desulfobulbaceae bacterium]SHH49892.1 respiratory nitrate reductase alpha subunit apoprotein [Desulfofustis glycolicus DSM 9705]